MDEIQSLYDQLQAGITAQLNIARNNEIKSQQLTDYDYSLRTFEKKLNIEGARQEKEKAVILSEKEYVEKRHKELDIKQESVKKLELLREEVKKEVLEIETKKQQLKEDQAKMETWQRDLKRREDLIESELKLDKKRKEQLNLQEVTNIQEKERLERLAKSLTDS